MEGSGGSDGGGKYGATSHSGLNTEAHPPNTSTSDAAFRVPSGNTSMSSSSSLPLHNNSSGMIVAPSSNPANPVVQNRNDNSSKMSIAATMLSVVPSLPQGENVDEQKSSHQVPSAFTEHDTYPMDDEKNDEDLDDTMREEDDDSEHGIREATSVPIVSKSMQDTTTTTTTTILDSATPSSPVLIVGGNIDEDALVLLDGRNEETGQRTTIPIRTMPVILGRTHETNDDSNFVGMGKDTKALSRQHVRIDYYYSEEGGTRVGEVLYKHGKFQYQESEIQEDDIINHEKQNDSIGFFAITVQGKNRILVNRKRIEKGQTCRLRNRDAIRISSFCLYFLIPDEKPNLRTLEIDIISSKTSNKRRLSGVSTCSSSNVAATTTGIQNKPHLSAMVKRNKTIQQDIESLSTEELLDLMTEAIEQNVWDRRHQLVGSTLSYRAVLEAAVAPSFENNYELSRTEIMDYIAEMPKFKQFVEQILTKVEAKSYQASVTKAMIKAGFSRTANSGRYIKWIIPEHLRYNSAKKASSSSSPNKQNGQDDKHKKSQQTEKEASNAALQENAEDGLDDDDNEQSMDDED
jgi:hypothetical protein